MIIERPKLLRRAGIACAAAAALFVGGCGFDPAAVPVPGAQVSGPTYRIDIEFASALNLPSKAKVFADGAEIGTVDAVEIVTPAEAQPGRGGFVRVSADIASDVHLPAETVAELRQDTLLGDIHVALTTPVDSSGPPRSDGTGLEDGDTIGIEHTRDPVQIEDSMSTMAMFVQGGAIGQLQDIVHRLNATLPEDPERTAQIAATLGADAIDLANNLDQVDLLVDGLTWNAEVLMDIPGELTNILTPEAVTALNGTQDSIDKAMRVFSALGPLGQSLAWLAPLAESGAAAGTVLLPVALGAGPDLRTPSNTAALIDLLNDKIIPLSERPAVRVTSAQLPGAPMATGDELDQLVQVLRMIGAVR